MAGFQGPVRLPYPVVPRKAGAHNHNCWWKKKVFANLPLSTAPAYGSPPPRGRHRGYLANRYAPPFSTERWKAGRACIRVSQAFRFGYGPSLSNTFAISPTQLIWISAPVNDGPTKNSRSFSAPST